MDATKITPVLRLNRAEIVDRLGGDDDLFCTLAAMFIDEASQYQEQLQAMFTAKNPGQLGREAHTVKGLFSTFSYEPGAACALEVEEKAYASEFANLDSKLDELFAHIQQLITLLQREIA